MLFSVLILDFLVAIVVLGGLRASWRLFWEQFWPFFGQRDGRWALLVGAGHSAGLLAHQIQSHPQSDYRIRGLLDTAEGAAPGSRLGGIPVVGQPEHIREIAAAYRATDVLVIAGSLPGVRTNTFHTSQWKLERAYEEDTLGELFGEADAETHGTILFGDPFSIHVSMLLEGLGQLLPDRPVVGGMASGAEIAIWMNISTPKVSSATGRPVM